MKTYKQLYEYGKAELAEAGIAEAQLDARLLLEYVCGTDHNTLLVHGEREVEEPKSTAYCDLILQRVAHTPLAYIKGTQEFMGLEFSVNKQVLIPNQDTETLVEEAMRLMHDGMRVLDLCTGSGCIALSLLHYTNDTSAVATDISEAALTVAVQNAGQLKLTERVSFAETDLFPVQKEKFDLIVSNPPYIPTEVIETLAPEVKNHEPRLALDGTEDGLSFYRRIIRTAPEWLFESGWLILEIGYDQGEAVSAMMRENGFRDIEVIRDLGGKDRVVTGCCY